MYGSDKIGITFWTNNTTNRDLGTDKWVWDRPEELTNTRSPAKLADQLLRGEDRSNCASFAEGKCRLGYDACCWVARTKKVDRWSLG